MQISDITITHYHFDDHSQNHCANVAMSSAEKTINLYCEIALPEQGDAASRARGFVAEAKRLLLKMPEYRGARRPSFAPHLV
jgi:predicted metallo-beta-lactamase superfamily hydrolase